MHELFSNFLRNNHGTFLAPFLSTLTNSTHQTLPIYQGSCTLQCKILYILKQCKSTINQNTNILPLEEYTNLPLLPYACGNSQEILFSLTFFTHSNQNNEVKRNA